MRFFNYIVLFVGAVGAYAEDVVREESVLWSNEVSQSILEQLRADSYEEVRKGLRKPILSKSRPAHPFDTAIRQQLYKLMGDSRVQSKKSQKETPDFIHQSISMYAAYALANLTDYGKEIRVADEHDVLKRWCEKKYGDVQSTIGPFKVEGMEPSRSNKQSRGMPRDVTDEKGATGESAVGNMPSSTSSPNFVVSERPKSRAWIVFKMLGIVLIVGYIAFWLSKSSKE